MGFLVAVFHLAQRVLSHVPPSVAMLIAEGISLAERATDSKGVPLDNAGQNQLAVEVVRVGVDALNAELTKHGKDTVDVDAAQLAECVSYLVDEAKAVARALDAGRTKVALSGAVQLSTVEVVQQAKYVVAAGEAQRKAFLG